MKRIKDFFHRNKVTLMLIPNAEKSIKQIKLNLAIAFGILIFLIIINLGLLISTLYSNYQAGKLASSNLALSESLQETQDKIASLKSIAETKTDQVDRLTDTLRSTTLYLTERLEEMDKAEEYLIQLVTLFNEKTNSKLDIPVSRSFRRTAYASGNEVASIGDINPDTILSDEERLIREANSLTQTDEIAELLQEKEEIYTQLQEKFENQLNYLDARPDYVPTQGILTSRFGYRENPFYEGSGIQDLHQGIDISSAIGTPIYAAGSGVVTFAGTTPRLGNLIIINHGYGYETIYAHNDSLLVTKGQNVSKAQQIAKMGRTGNVTGIHLHFEIRYNKVPVNPFSILNSKLNQ